MMRDRYFFALFLVVLSCFSTTAQRPSQFPTTANLSTTWTNNNSFHWSVTFRDGTVIRPILLRNVFGPSFACGFYCLPPCTSYLFSVFIVLTSTVDGVVDPDVEVPQVVWSANRDHLVGYGSTLSLTAFGEMVLRDVNGSTVWTSKSAGKSVAGLNLTREGNLVLFDTHNLIVWQSFDHPTDCLLPGQRLIEGQQLIPSVSETNWTSQKGLISVQVTDVGLVAYIGNPPQLYKSIFMADYRAGVDIGRSYVQFLNGSLPFVLHSDEFRDPNLNVFPLPPASSAQYMKLTPLGHLQVLEWQQRWTTVAEVFNREGPDCYFPLACGRNALCSEGLQCSCPIPISRLQYFLPVNARKPSLGCYEITPLTCNATQDQEFISLKNVDYFNQRADMEGVDVKTCKQACATNCSCKFALFRYDSNSSDGACFLPSEFFTIVSVDPDVEVINSTAFIKVQKSRPNPTASQSRPAPTASQSPSTTRVILISTCASVAFVLGVMGFLIYVIRRRRMAAQMEEESSETEEESIRNIQGMPTRYGYENLKSATDNFNKKLGEGGFGAVFEGTLEDGSKIAVKCLEGLGQVKKSFLAEVESIGSIHHMNLVRLRGFCAWKSQRLLVYEFMSNGSLDRWIYHGVREHALEWKCIKKIILDVAKGLAYLHEDCRQKIIHLDIKPQNILLDCDFNAKVSDFGLAKLIDRNQSAVVLTMRGTPGYLAPEWLSSVITEKVDVYSFGIVLLETVCGRKKFDKSWPEDSWHLLDVFQKCWEHGTLPSLVDMYSEDMQAHNSEVVEMMELAAWCLQYDYTKRPSMSMVVDVLVGKMKVESSLSYNLTYPSLSNTLPEQSYDMTPLKASILSGPR